MIGSSDTHTYEVIPANLSLSQSACTYQDPRTCPMVNSQECIFLSLDSAVSIYFLLECEMVRKVENLTEKQNSVAELMRDADLRMQVLVC